MGMFVVGFSSTLRAPSVLLAIIYLFSLFALDPAQMQVGGIVRFWSRLNIFNADIVIDFEIKMLRIIPPT